MSRIYIYPKNDYNTLDVPNPYVLHVEENLQKKHTLVNEKPNNKGVVELFQFLPKTDVYFFNWIEDIATKRFGLMQYLLFPAFLLLAGMLGKKIVWVMHNWYSHQKRNRRLTSKSFDRMVRYSNLIITHSQRGVELVREKFPAHAHKVKYIVHPVEELFSIAGEKPVKKFDFLIWGTIFPYKRVLEFLDFVKKNPKLGKAKIRITGVCIPEWQKAEIEKHVNSNISYIDGFLDLKDIARMANQSEYVLFTYNDPSVLSSGSLMDSIRMGAKIIGPDSGAFRDLKQYSFMETFNSYDDIVDIFEGNRMFKLTNFDETVTFCEQNSWKLFGDKLFKVSDGIL
ncbi:MAG: hypothetical protein JXB34_12620 [Bacteroidales bacterium]|nr:hypothetical protein [Bacteroidales bacterium]